MTSQQLDLFPNAESSQQGGPAKTSPSLAVVRAWTVSVQGCGGTSHDFLTKHAPAGSSARTSLDSCRLTADRTWVPSSGRWGNSGMGSPTEFWTLSSSEFPSAAAASSLSGILENPGPHLRKYFLSAKAASGILRRAAKRGRKLPVPLLSALESLAEAGGGLVPTVSSKWAKGTGGPSGDECQNLVLEDTHTHTTISTLQGGGKRGYRIDAESAAGGHLIVARGGGCVDR